MKIIPTTGIMENLVNDVNSNFTELDEKIKTIEFSIPVTGVVDTIFNFLGEDRTHSAGETGDYSTIFGLQNQHCSLKINSITGSGTVTFTGTSITEASGTVTTGDTEVLNITTANELQTSKKWLEMTSIVFSVGVTAIDYDIEILGYIDMGNSSWELLGYRADLRTSGNASDFALILTKIQDNGNGVHSHVVIEDYGHDSTASNGKFFDNKRNIRDATLTSNLAPNDAMICYKCLDFSTYFSSDENIFDGSKNEGLIIHCEGRDAIGAISGISQIDYLTLTLYYTN